MPFDARTLDEIAETQLDDLAARYTANGRTLDTSDVSDARMRAEVIALVVGQYDAWGAQLDDEILPDKATFTLARHGAVEGLVLEPAVAAVLQLLVTGVASATVALAGITLVDPSTGDAWNASANADGSGASIALDGSGDGTAYATAQLAGAAGNRPVTAILTWSTTPANANPGPSVAATHTPGVDVESPADFAARIIAYRQDRPAGGNRSDWRTWCLDVPGCEDALPYSLLHPTYGVGTPGAITIVVLGPVQGASASNTRILSGGLCTTIHGYLNGDNNADGSTAPTPNQLRPAAMAPADFAIVPAIPQTQDVELQVVLAASAPQPWAYNAGYVVVAGSTASAIKLAGDLSAILKVASVCLPVLIDIGTAAQRGGYVLVPTASIASVAYDGTTNTTITLTAPLAATPVTGSVVLPGLPNFPAIQADVFAYFDGLGPGDTSPPSRWPSEETRLRAKLYRSALVGALSQTVDANGVLLTGVAGVLAALAVTPSGDVQPAAKTLLVLGTLSVHV